MEYMTIKHIPTLLDSNNAEMFGIPGPIFRYCTPNSSLGLRTPTDSYKGWDATSSPGNFNVFRYAFTYINLPIY